MRRLFVAAASLAAIIGMSLLSGFLAFAFSMPRATEATPAALKAAAGSIPPEARGIVALTGGAGLRIEEALRLHEAGIGDRVLISGVNPQITKADLAGTGSAAVLECCVDLGPYARTTKGNALEARSWLRSHRYELVYLVTSNFHLQRARAEMEELAPELVVIGVPVDSRTVPERGWIASPAAWHVLASEYAKLLFMRLRSVVEPW
ncbi:YdcF family protein [Parvularcula oceani]|uniref:YdcF family protein n=1 Tax=Parvularcula oceani TaxID=1247963 RepID=UPI00068C897D|nr:YdcF family protein [Parvularcula oceani]